MKCISLIAFAFLTLLAATKAATTTFDGTWSVTIDFHEYVNPDGSTARATVKSFPVKIKNGVLHGELGTRAAPDWYSLDGKIEVDGSAILRTTGITGKPEYTASITHPRSSVPYEYQVMAHFGDRRGTGKSVGNPPRVRIFTFVKD